MVGVYARFVITVVPFVREWYIMRAAVRTPEASHLWERGELPSACLCEYVRLLLLGTLHLPVRAF